MTGVLALAVGESTRLTATTSDGQEVTGQSTWKTSDATVAKVGVAGLVTAIRPGPAVIQAEYLGYTGTLEIAVGRMRLSPPVIAACGDVIAPGAYVVTADASLPQISWPCLDIGIAGVSIDCGGHAISGVRIADVENVTIANCAVTMQALVKNSRRVRFERNTMSEIELIGGGSNEVVQNTIDGGYDGSGRLVGADDGVVLIDEDGDTVQFNTIRNVFDAGVEGVDAVGSTLIADNTIENTGTAGISSYWCTSWMGNTIARNTATRVPNLVFFDYRASTTKCPNPATPAAFAGNRFIGNRFASRIPGGADPAMYFYFPELGAAQVFDNLIQGNDLGREPGPMTVPAAGFLNGGGNICIPGTSPLCGG